MTVAGNPANRRNFSLADITDALNQAAQDGLEVHRQAGQPLVVWHNGKTVLVSPDSFIAAVSEDKPKKSSRKPPRK